jgi:hypothetical protein
MLDMLDREANPIFVGERVKLLSGPNAGKYGNVIRIDFGSRADCILVADAWPDWRWASWVCPEETLVMTTEAAMAAD